MTSKKQVYANVISSAQALTWKYVEVCSQVQLRGVEIDLDAFKSQVDLALELENHYLSHTLGLAYIYLHIPFEDVDMLLRQICALVGGYPMNPSDLKRLKNLFKTIELNFTIEEATPGGLIELPK